MITVLLIIINPVLLFFLVFFFWRRKNYKKLLLKNIENEKIFKSVIKNEIISYWSYNPRKHTAEVQFYEVNNLPSVVYRNFPESYFKPIIYEPEEMEKILKAFSEIEEGKDYASCIIHTKSSDGEHWEQLKLFSINNENGSRVSIAGAELNIDNLKYMERQYKEELRFINNIDDENMICKCRINLTANHTDFFIAGDLSNVFKPEDSADSLFENFKSRITDERMKSIDIRLTLIDKFRHGTTIFTKQLQLENPLYDIYYFSLTCHLFENQENNCIMAFIYTYNITDSIFERNIIHALTKNEYDFFAFVRLKEKTLSQIDTGEDSHHLLKKEQVTYNSFINLVQTSINNQPERFYVSQMLSLKNVLHHLSNSPSWFFTFRCTDENGELRQKKVQFTYLDQTETSLMMNISDITSGHKVEQENMLKLEKALEEAREANRAKTDFFARMSHDIRTPLNGIIGITELTINEEISDNAREALKKIQSSGRFLLGLVNNILDLSKAESEKQKLSLSPFSLDELLNYLDAVIIPLCNEREIRFIKKLKPTDSTIYIDHQRFYQILFNLLSNAVKFTPEKGTVTLEIQNNPIDDKKTAIKIIISDTGIGMSDEFKKKLFTPFSQEENVHQPYTTGSGLGLVIVKQSVDAMNGTIDVKSKVGEGSVFTIDFECNYTTETEKVFKRVVKIDDSVLKGKRILLCEDNELNKEIALRLLNRKGMQVTCASNGQIGYEKFCASEKNYFDAILMDRRMPVMNGLEATRIIRNLPREDARTIPIIAMTANAFEDDVKNSIEAGMTEHLAKPIEPETLFFTLAKYICQDD